MEIYNVLNLQIKKMDSKFKMAKVQITYWIASKSIFVVEIWYFPDMGCFVDKLTTFCFKKGPERKPYKNKYQLIDVTHEINKEAA